jgi:predicted RNA-binding protein YlxR (DUF448 family)
MNAELDLDLTERMCIVTREVKDEDALVRFVRSPDGQVVPDLQRKLPGRGVWVSLSREKVNEAVKKGLFSRGFAAETKATPELADLVGDDGRGKIDKLAAPGVKVINIFQVDELDLAFGRSNVIHAAVARGKLAEKLLLAVQRIEMYDAHSERLVTEERA